MLEWQSWALRWPPQLSANIQSRVRHRLNRCQKQPVRDLFESSSETRCHCIRAEMSTNVASCLCRLRKAVTNWPPWQPEVLLWLLTHSHYFTMIVILQDWLASLVDTNTLVEGEKKNLQVMDRHPDKCFPVQLEPLPEHQVRKGQTAITYKDFISSWQVLLKSCSYD